MCYCFNTQAQTHLQAHIESYQFAVPSVNMDTLYILSNDLGKLTYEIWNKQPICCGFLQTPVLRFVDSIEQYRNRYLNKNKFLNK